MKLRQTDVDFECSTLLSYFFFFRVRAMNNPNRLQLRFEVDCGATYVGHTGTGLQQDYVCELGDG